MMDRDTLAVRTDTDMPPNPGAMTRLANLFINSRLTPLLVAAMLLIGLFAISLTPREEEPQIVVPMIDVMVMLPGATPLQVENLVTKPLEQKIWEIEDVEYVYSSSFDGFSLVTARYLVGTDMDGAVTRLWNKILGNMDLAPLGILQPLIKVRSIDDVPVLTLTLWSEHYDLYDLRQLAGELRGEIAAVENVSVVDLHGGRRRAVRVEPDPQRLAAHGVTMLSVLPALQMQNQSLPAGSLSMAGQEFSVETSAFLRDADDVANLVVGVFNGRPVRLQDVAAVTDGPAEIDSYAFFGVGPRAADIGLDTQRVPVGSEQPAVTISVAKRKGSDATRVTEAVRAKVEQLRGRLIPADVEVTVTRDYGETANEKARSLIQNLGLAILLAMAVVFLAMGWRGSLIIFVSIPTTFALTLFSYYMLGYTLNRVTLFALILVNGLVVDGTIIVVENIHRHFQERGRRSVKIALRAIQEVGNPTILATLTVIASLFPMAFVSGLMGPYMRPMPIGASLAMLFSLLVAFVIAPWFAMRVLKPQHGAGGDTAEATGRRLQDTMIFKLYERTMRPLISRPARGVLALIAVAVLTGASTLLFFTRMVEVKMLPFDNKSEFQVIVDMPEGTTLEQTTSVAREIGTYLATVPEVTDYQLYAGQAAPVNFSGLVRHYMLRRGPNVADLQVNLVDKSKRRDQSHAIAVRVREPIAAIAARHGAAVKVVEVPPGPPVLATLVAEVYGPDFAGRLEVARQIKEIFETTPGVVDVDWFVEADQTRYRFVVDKERAAVRGVSSQQVAQTLAVALAGLDVGLVHVDDAAEPVPVNVRLPLVDRGSADALGELFVGSQDGGLVPLADVVRIEETVIDKSRHRRNLKPLIYVTGDVAGRLESPVYAILDMRPRIAAIPLPDGVEMSQHFRAQPELTERFSLKWDGEWHITYEVFRDLGAAFAVVMVIIYLLIVAMFQSFTIPLLMMIPIPLTLIGIVPGHLMFGAFFTATSMIGLIALAGIMVRNSVLLIDFIIARQKQGLALDDAVVEAGAVRFLPIVLTAGTVVAGSFVMIFDPIFQGMAISLMMGALLSTVLTIVVIPLAYYLFARGREDERTRAI
ncbi:MAG: efflux RND transporter permease subunit [Candidatus Krumholzibacteria bacterium]|nr:efflux RND transporter permease subunit [Candidatus Krumholzibacteria bacterium]